MRPHVSWQLHVLLRCELLQLIVRLGMILFELTGVVLHFAARGFLLRETSRFDFHHAALSGLNEELLVGFADHQACALIGAHPVISAVLSLSVRVRGSCFFGGSVRSARLRSCRLSEGNCGPEA